MKKIFSVLVLFFTMGSLLMGCSQPSIPEGLESTEQVITPNAMVSQETQIKTDMSDVSYSTPEYVPVEKVLSPDKIKKLVAAYNANLGYKPEKPIAWDFEVPGSMKSDQILKDYYHFYNVGTLKQAPYEGWNLLVLSIDCDGPCFTTSLYRYAQNPANGDLVLFSKYFDSDNASNANFVAMKAVYTADDKTELASLNAPATLSISGGDAVVKLKFMDSDYIPEQERNSKASNVVYKDVYINKLFDSSIGPVYADYNDGMDVGSAGVGCLHVKKPDGSVATYSFDFGYDTKGITMKLKDGTSKDFNSNYAPADKGCGIGNSCYYTRTVNEKNLEEYGTLSNGLKIYKPIKTVENADEKTYLQQADISVVSTMYQVYAQAYQYGDKSKPKVTFQEYLKKTPVLFWKDPFNRWSAVVAVDYVPAAECGKPVLYFYPEKDTKVKVQVGIDKITKTIPEYGTQGWSVLAHPDGQLINDADGKIYPYLFWEGQSQKTVEAEGGFTVARGDLENFLNKTLMKAGLNQQESKDFMEFWYSRMMLNKEPYFILKFLGTKDFNKIAPLNISPKPDTLARIFMYYQPSYYKVNLKPQIINGFQRNGFTVVEWGGTSNTTWLQ